MGCTREPYKALISLNMPVLSVWRPFPLRLAIAGAAKRDEEIGLLPPMALLTNAAIASTADMRRDWPIIPPESSETACLPA